MRGLRFAAACRAVEREGGLAPITVRPPILDTPTLTIYDIAPTPLVGNTPGWTWHSLLAPAPNASEGPEWEAACRASGPVSKKLASYLTIMLLLYGLASALTCSFWGSLSDRVGRKPLLLLDTFGSCTDPIAMGCVYLFPERFGISFIVVLMTLRGLLGGEVMSTSVGNAYFADATAGSKTGVLSLTTGTFFGGAMLGPLFGAAVFRWTGILILPYVALIVLNVIQAVALLAVIPESLSPGRMRTERLRQTAASREHALARREEAARWRAARKSTVGLLFLRLWRRMVSVIEPMAVLLPKLIEEDGSPSKADAEPAALAPKRKWRKGRRDWNLFLVALCYGLQMCVAGLGPVKLLYSQHQFDWTAEDLGFYITFSSATKLVVLLVVLPLGIRLFKPTAPTPSRLRPSSEEALERDDPQAALSALTAAQKAWDEEAAQLKLVTDSQFDLRLARTSTIVAGLSYLVFAVPSPHESMFLLGTACVSLASGDIPALTSLALSLAPPTDSGRVLASLGVLSSLVAQVFGPPVFSAIYIRTVDFFPTFCFVVAAGWFAVAYIPSILVNLEDEKMDDEQGTAEPLLAQ